MRSSPNVRLPARNTEGSAGDIAVAAVYDRDIDVAKAIADQFDAAFAKAVLKKVPNALRKAKKHNDKNTQKKIEAVQDKIRRDADLLARVCIPEQNGRSFRAKTANHSGAKWPMIPAETGRN